MTAREVLDGIRGRLAAATPGPWEFVGNDIELPSPRYGVVLETSVECGSYCYGGSARQDISEGNREFIAAAPTDVARLVAAVEAVLAVHEPMDAAMFSGRHERIVKVCTGCGTDDGNWQRWPCPTIAAIEAALKEDPQ